jgi:hypothetical protein
MTPSNPFNLKPKTIEDHNRQAEQALAFFLRDFPQTYRLLAGSRFQVPVGRQADYMNYAHSIYGDAWTFIRATPCRAGRWGQGDRDAWRQVAGEFTVVNEWLKQGQTTLFVERELGEALKRTDLPEGFSPQDLHWRWNAFRLVLPLGLFRVKFRVDDPHQEGWDTDIPIVTVAKVLKRQSLDFHPTLFQETQAAFGREPLGDTWPNEDAVLFSIQRKPTDPKHKKILDFSGGCKLDDRTLRTLAEEIDVAAEVLPFWDSDSSAFVVGIKRFIFNALLYMGSFPEEYEPEKVLRPFSEKKGRWKPAIKAARFLGKEAYRPARRPTGAEHEPTGRQLPGHWRAGHWRRQAFGEGSLQRKLIWIQPYKTAGPDA